MPFVKLFECFDTACRKTLIQPSVWIPVVQFIDFLTYFQMKNTQTWWDLEADACMTFLNHQWHLMDRLLQKYIKYKCSQIHEKFEWTSNRIY